ncbi:MAG: DNA translocase FtsK 4TM domain-containing protein [Bacteroidaceae bacterium]|nr:DNA translocase FtsK 4TM domain-containing protein [Bacteroidaceae bacterium]
MTKKNTKKEKTPGRLSRMWTALTGRTSCVVVGICFSIFLIFLASSFVSFVMSGGADNSLIETGSGVDLNSTDNGVTNCTGSLGARMAMFLMNGCFGWAAFAMLPFLLALVVRLFDWRRPRLVKWFIASVFGLVWGSLFFSFLFGDLMAGSFLSPGGEHGERVAAWLVSQIGPLGMVLLLLVSLVLFMIYLTRDTIKWIKSVFNFGAAQVGKLKPSSSSDDENEEDEEDADDEENEVDDSQEVLVNEDETPAAEDAAVASEEEHDGFTVELPVENEVLPEDNGTALDEETGDEKVPFDVEQAEDDDDTGGKMLQPINPKDELSYYKSPTLDLLDKYEAPVHSIDMEEQTANKNRIVEVLRNFDIEISSIKATVGPTITLYELTPAPGVRINKIRGLEDDIAMSLSALCIRIIAPIPGKGTIGIEVPNSNKQIVPMVSLLNSRKFKESEMALPLALGKTISNEIYMVDLAKMPHLLVAGATGMGKSVGLNAIITSLLYKMHPAYLKFVMVDPKMVELSLYRVLEKHFLAKLENEDESIITDVMRVVRTLKSLCVEMDNRYKLLQAAKVRSVKEYNEKFLNRTLLPTEGHRFMPYIVVIIDEYGDLMMQAGKEIELPIARIAQKARAVGIHMIIATQRPTTNIITGTIKANFPARMAFRVISPIDSRTILERTGANQLQGRGDMLFLAGNDPVRVQCALVETNEVERVCDFIARQQGYSSAYFLPDPDEAGGDTGGSTARTGEISSDRLDPLFADAARTVVLHQQGSTSMLQRKYNIGFNRAGRIMDQLCQTGIVGEQDGSKPRQVLCSDEADLEFRLKSLL